MNSFITISFLPRFHIHHQTFQTYSTSKLYNLTILISLNFPTFSASNPTQFVNSHIIRQLKLSAWLDNYINFKNLSVFLLFVLYSGIHDLAFFFLTVLWYSSLYLWFLQFNKNCLKFIDSCLTTLLKVFSKPLVHNIGFSSLNLQLL